MKISESITDSVFISDISFESKFQIGSLSNIVISETTTDSNYISNISFESEFQTKSLSNNINIITSVTPTNSNYLSKNININYTTYVTDFIDINQNCYYTCESCEINGNNITHNCLKCKDNFTYEINFNNYTNCYDQCYFYHYYDNENKYHCTLSCPYNYPKLIEDKMECIKNIEIKNIVEELLNIINKNDENKPKDKEEEAKFYDTILESIETSFTSENYDTSNLDKGEDEVIETEKITVTFTTTQNQKNNQNSSVTIVDLGECENILRKYYNISKNQTIYMKKIEVVQDGMNIPKIEYDVYSKIGNKLEKLNISVCENTKIYLSIRTILSDSLDIYNSSSGYYNDICYTATSESGTDISLNDRKNEYANKALCQDECELSDYDYTTQKVNCSCDVKESSSSVANMEIDKKKLLKNFGDIKNIMNIKILVCYKKLFTKKSIINNYGFYIISSIIFLHIIFILIFCLKQKNEIKNKIKDIIFGILNYDLIKPEENKIIVKDNIKEIKEQENKNNKSIILKVNKNKNKQINNFVFTTINNEKTIKRKKIKNIKNKRNKSHNRYKKKDINNIVTSDDRNETKKMDKSQTSKTISMLYTKIKQPEFFEKVKSIMKFTDDEINGLSYELALQHDKRTFFQYYISLIKTKHNFIYTFCYYNDYNSKIMKIDLFFINFAMLYTVNGLFFDDDSMHQIYETNGKYDFLFQLPKIIYSQIISTILSMILQVFALQNDSIVSFKENKLKENLLKRKKILERGLKIKIIIYIIISFIFLLFFCYYLSMFGTIYRNTQYHLLKDTLLSFILSFFDPFGICLLPCIFRIPSLSNPKKNRKCLYQFSQLFNILN